MKVAIVTITDGANYGNRLQNYALQSVIQELGYEAYTIKVKTSNDRSPVERIIFILKNRIKKILGREYIEVSHKYQKRRRRFYDFNARYINYANETLKFNSVPENIADKYDYFVVGSDQVWNTRSMIISENISTYLLSFVPPNKRISYAASFGTKDIPNQYIAMFTAELSKFSNIGVREIEGISLVEQLCNKKAELVLDPTLLLETTRWDELCKRPLFNCPSRYVLTYFLGGRSHKMKKYINSVASDLNCEIINLDNDYISELLIEDEEHYKATPDEFLWLIKHATCVLTDSFHGTVFSIMYGIPFYVFGRINVEKGNEMSSRITTLLSIFNMNDRLKSIESPIGMPGPFFTEDINDILKLRRAKSLDYLRNALDKKE